MAEAARAETAAAMAERVVRDFFARDRMAALLGIELGPVAPGRASARLRVTETMTNPHGTCHGGISCALADAAFSYACVTWNEQAVGQHCNVSYLAPARPGDILTAEAAEVTRSGRNAIYDITVTGAEGRVVLTCRGVAFIKGGAILPPGELEP
jgi:acyl-CoA thioesterase